MAASDLACHLERLLCHTDNVFVSGSFRAQAYKCLYLFINRLSGRVPATPTFAAVIKGDMIRLALQVCQNFCPDVESMPGKTDINANIYST